MTHLFCLLREEYPHLIPTLRMTLSGLFTGTHKQQQWFKLLSQTILIEWSPKNLVTGLHRKGLIDKIFSFIGLLLCNIILIIQEC